MLKHARWLAGWCLQVVVEMVQNKLAEDDVKTHGWLLDGYPRRCGGFSASGATNTLRAVHAVPRAAACCHALRHTLR